MYINFTYFARCIIFENRVICIVSFRQVVTLGPGSPYKHSTFDGDYPSETERLIFIDSEVVEYQALRSPLVLWGACSNRSRIQK
jgi:hypothetical protein